MRFPIGAVVVATLLARAVDGLNAHFLHVRHVKPRERVVDLHLRAMTTPAAAGERFIASSDLFWFSELAMLLRAELAEKARRVSTRTAPDWLIRLGALFNPEMKQIAPNLGLRLAFSTAKAERMLGWRPSAALMS